MAAEPLDIVGISRATIAPDGEKVTLSLVDLENNEYDISLTYRDLGRTLAKLLAVAEGARAQRKDGGHAEDSPLPHADAILPYPIVRYALGLSEDKTQIALRLVSDNDLIWDFVLPLEGLETLQNDLTRLEALSRRHAVPDGGNETA